MTPMARRSSPEMVYQFDIRLVGINPPIWQYFVVSDRITLLALHHLLQVVMGWQHSHLHQFLANEVRYEEPGPGKIVLSLGGRHIGDYINYSWNAS